MNYYKRHIGDYAKKAGHLSALEHGVYTLILDAYYDRELAPTRAEAIRQARARTPEEMAAVDAVLADFFNEVDGRFVQSRVEEEFVKAEEVAIRNRAVGKLGGRPRKPKGKPEETITVSDTNPQETRTVSTGNPKESHRNPNPLIHQSTTKEQDQKSLRTSCASVSELLDDVSPEVAQDFTELRKKKRAPLTATAMKGIRREAAKAGLSLDTALAICCERGWQSFRADWDWRASARAGPQVGATSKAGQAIEILEGMKRGHQNIDSGTDAAVLVPRIGTTACG